MKDKDNTEESDKVFLHLPYDPHGPSRAELADIFCFDDLQPALDMLKIPKVTISYSKPPDLQSILAPTKFRED